MAQAKVNYDYDLIIIGCGVGGHGAALHAVESVSYKLADTACVAATLSFCAL